MLKKKTTTMSRNNIIQILNYINTYLFKSFCYVLGNKTFYASNNLRVSHPKKQFWFNFFTSNLLYSKIFSSGHILNPYTKKFKFFKKSQYSINPLIFKLFLLYKLYLSKLYLLESKNFTKKHKIFLTKLFTNAFIKIKFIVFSKVWVYVTKPVKRIKRRVLRLLKNT